MDQQRWEQIKVLLDSAVELRPERRSGFLAEACANDQSLRAEVEGLLMHYEQAGDFLEGNPGADLYASIQSKTDEPAFSSGEIIAARFRIIDLIGRGGMGEVYKAEDMRLHRTVALKFLPDDTARHSHALERFQREAQAASALNHPNICTIYDVGEHEGKYFIAMELLEGQPLLTRIAAKPLQTQTLLDLAVQIVEGLSAAHAKGIIHRDIKPANIFITEHGHAKILDFGLARKAQLAPGDADNADVTLSSTEPRFTGHGEAVGTLTYMSPEQARGEELDTRTDLFSFGAVLYEMATGRSPFSGRTSAIIFDAILNKEPAPPLDLNPKLPLQLQEIINKALEKDRNFRYQRADDIKTDLRRLKRDIDSGLRPIHPRVVPAGSHLEPRLHAIQPRLIAAIAGVMVIAAAVTFIVRGKGSREPTSIRVVPLTSYPGVARSPSFSPDGNMIAFAWNGGTLNDRFDLYVKAIGNEKAVKLTDHPTPYLEPAWSPDGKYIVFSRASENGSGIFLISSLGGPERKLANLAEINGPPNWTPDGKQIAYVDATDDLTTRRPSGGHLLQQIFLLNVETLEKQALPAPPNCFRPNFPAFSPDGRFLAFECYAYMLPQERTQAGLVVGHRIYIQPAKGGGSVREVTTINGHWIWGLTWSSDSQSLIYNLDGHLWRVSAPGGTPQDLLFAQDVWSRPTVSRNGRLAYARTNSSPSLWRLDLASPGKQARAPVKIVASAHGQSSPSISPDNKHITFISYRSGSEELWMCDIDGGNLVQLTTIGARWKANWSSDSKRVLFWSPASGLYSLEVEGGVPQRLPPLPAFGAWRAAWSRDDKWIYLNSSFPVDAIWKMPVEGGNASQLVEGESYWQGESADGRSIYFLRGSSEQSSLWLVSSQGDHERRLDTPRLDTIFGHWAVGENGIYFRDVPGALVYLDLSTNRVQQVLARADLGLGLADYGMDLSRNGRILVYSQLDELTGDIMLVEGLR